MQSSYFEQSRAAKVFLMGLYLVASMFSASVCAQSNSPAKETLNFSLLVFGGKQRSAYSAQIKLFESIYPHIKVNLRAVEAEAYKQGIEQWLRAEQHSDVMYWFGGERLRWYIKEGLVRQISGLWKNRGWDRQIAPSAKSAVRSDGEFYALPVHYYHWGLYYRKTLFAQLNLTAPQTWDEFLAVCETLQRNGIAPLAIGSKEHWPVAGWFDYLNLRLHGLDFHMDLVHGKVSYQDARIRNVFQQWRTLIDKEYFQPDHANLAWRDVLPFMYRGSAGMMLMGNFWTTQIPAHLKNDFSVMPFPQMREDVPFYEEAPTNVLFIPNNAVNTRAAELFLDFMSRSGVQAELNSAVGMLAPQINAGQQLDHFLERGRAILDRAEGISQYFDRDNPKPIAVEGVEQMARFMRDPARLEDVLVQLEKLRHISFGLPQGDQ